MTLRLMREALGEADLSDFENLSPPQAARRSTTADHQQPAGIHVTNHHHNQQEQHQQASSSSPSLAFRGGGAPPPTPGWTGPPAPPPSMQGMPPHMLPLHTGNQNHQHNHNHNRHGLQPRGSLQPQLLAQTQPQPPLYFDWQRHHHPHHQGGCFSTGVPPTLACIPPAFAPGLASGNINVRNTHDLAKPNLYVGITRPVTTAATIPATVCTTGIVTPTATPSSSGESVTSTESSINGNSANKPTNSTNSKRLAFAALAKTSGPTIPIKTKSPINKNNVPSTSIRQHPRPLSMPAVAAAANTPPPSPRLYAVRLMIHWLRHGQHRIVTCVFGRLCDLLMAAMADVQGNPGAYPYHRPTGIPPPPPPPVYSSAFKNGYAGVIGNNRAGERQAGPSTGAPTPGTGMTGPAPPPAVVPTIHGTLRAIVLRGIVRGEAIDMRSSGDDLSRLYASLGPDEVPAFEVLVDEVLMSSPDEASDADDGDDEEDGYGARYRDVAAGV
ncbi:hypothetical protein F5Y16DRAFT_18398 [Xylariaceae sp. FL0255]|nr:hypothetical protein F5Y16DRAFT_18398 [Xylariaceae sp. FL0255]